MPQKNLSDNDVKLLAKTHASKISWNSIVDCYGFWQIHSQRKRPNEKGILENPESFQNTCLLPEISEAWEEFRAFNRDPELLAQKALNAVEVGYLAPYIRDLRLEEKQSLIDREVESILVVNKTASRDGSELLYLFFSNSSVSY